MKNSPCYRDGHDCPMRSQICHAQCKEYHDWVNEIRKVRIEERRTMDADAHTKRTIEINTKRANGKRKVVGQR